MLDKRLLKILACPVCKGDLVYRTSPESLYCPKGKVVYKVEGGIPNLLPPKKHGGKAVDSKI